MCKSSYCAEIAHATSINLLLCLLAIQSVPIRNWRQLGFIDKELLPYVTLVELYVLLSLVDNCVPFT